MYTLMNKAKPVLSFKVDKGFIVELHMINLNLAPEILKLGHTGSLERWLAERCMDLTRFNARLLAKKLNLSLSPVEIVLSNRALTLVDTYWVMKQEGEKYTDFCLYRREENRLIAMTSLSGSLRHVRKEFNPELTNIGSFDKAWMKYKGKWALKKKGDSKSIYSELFAYYLAKELGLDCAEYEIDRGVLISPNFTNETKVLEHYASYRFRFEDIGVDDEMVYANLSTVGLGEAYLDILFLDALICNVDRHEFNFGVLKNPLTGSLIGLAPNFDNNLAFGGVSNPSTQMAKLFVRDFGLNAKHEKLIKELTLESLSGIDKKVRQAVNPKELTREAVGIYFKAVLDVFKRAMQQ